MNKIYKVIWSKVRNCYVAVSEIAKRNGKSCTSVNCGAKANRRHAGVAHSAAVGATLLAGVCSVLLPVHVALAAPVMPTLDYRGATADVTIASTSNNTTATMNITSTIGIEFAVAQTILSVDADRKLSLENRGMKQPPAMTPQEVAEQVHAQQGNGNGVAAQVNDNAGAPGAPVNGNAGVTGNEGATGITGNGVSTAAANENGAVSNTGVAGAVNAAMDVVQQTDNAVGTEESKRKKGVA